MRQGAIGRLYEVFLGLPNPVVLGALWVVGGALLGLCAGALPTLGGAGVRIGRGTVGEQAEGPLTPWEETGSGGLDAWFESPGGHDAMVEGFCGEPGGSHEYLSLMEHYLATLEGEKRHEGYYEAHLRREHPAEEYGEARVRERIAAHSYRYRPISSAPRARYCARGL